MEADLQRASMPDGDFWTQGLDRGFFSRVYIRAVQIGVVATILSLVFDQRTVALGLLSGLAMGIFSMWTVEMTVRLLFNGGSFAGVKLAVGAVVKMPLMLGGLLGVAWACYHGHMNVFGVIGGVLIAHGAMLAMVLATAVAAQESNRERYR
jgi:hypothetical protein